MAYQTKAIQSIDPAFDLSSYWGEGWTLVSVVSYCSCCGDGGSFEQASTDSSFEGGGPCTQQFIFYIQKIS